ncbi:MAG: LytTR family DNA-binding domain-containing protein [Oscillospiraceae bacterium]
MKITIETPENGAEDEIIIRCAALDEELMELISALYEGRSGITAYGDGGITKLKPRDIFYFESVDSKVFAYCEKQVYEVKRKLYELEEDYAHTDFLRISKSVILNVAKIERLTPKLNGRFEALLQNGEKTVISRQYVPVLKKKLGVD